MSSQPFYHLRPNKYLDRQNFLSTLSKLEETLSFDNYVYVGFGSYLFDDFKLMHNRFNIKKMISLECDLKVAERAEFNKPFKCIEIIKESSTEYINSFSHDEKSNYIFWLDYTAPSELRMQFADFVTFIRNMEHGDILRITLNATPSSLGEERGLAGEELRDKRLKTLKDRIEDYLPIDVDIDMLTTERYPRLLLKALKKAMHEALYETQFQSLFPVPIASAVYQDGMQMLTFTLIVLDDHKQEEKIISKLFPVFCDNPNYLKKIEAIIWEDPQIIAIPDLTTKEILEVNSMLPEENAELELSEKFSFVFNGPKNAKDYLKYYKNYPYFREVNF